MRFYREAAQALGFEVLDQRDLVRNLRTHYSRVFEELEARRLELEGKSSQEYLDKMRVGLKNWVEAADNGHSRVGPPTFPKTRLTPICQLPTAAIDSTAGRRRYR
ncbi:methyltransferase [Mycobacterium canetti]|uniref:methyltransferase n=1 Tax=Mycobacterium canetti TaxID=78331 RepID=UPI002D776569|nr:methyltransferase [Mycobacterium canetti]